MFLCWSSEQTDEFELDWNWCSRRGHFQLTRKYLSEYLQIYFTTIKSKFANILATISLQSGFLSPGNFSPSPFYGSNLIWSLSSNHYYIRANSQQKIVWRYLKPSLSLFNAFTNCFIILILMYKGSTKTFAQQCMYVAQFRLCFYLLLVTLF